MALKDISRRVLAGLLAGLFASGGSVVTKAFGADGDEEQFSGYEIRVIRPRYFAKSGRLETGAELSVIMNQTFIYTYLATGILDYHFSESWAAELSGAFGVSVDKQDKKILKSEFDIDTSILRTKYWLLGDVVWTPIYGKYQLSTGRLVYFDTFLTLGGGMTGIEYLFDHCKDPGSYAATVTNRPPPIPAAKTVSYPTINFGIGQRFFLTRTLSLRWDVRDGFFSYSSQDGSCDPASSQAEARTHHNVTMQLGGSQFF